MSASIPRDKSEYSICRSEIGCTDCARRIVLAAADGLTNSELARRLYISPKTAAVHVSNILRKLGISSRTEVAELVGAGPRRH